jgi:hypothetical protein
VKIHALLVKVERELVVLRLDGAYSVSVGKTGTGSTLTIDVPPTMPSQQAGALASFTALYGVNGSGKTRLLLALCKAAQSGARSAQFAAVWTDSKGRLSASRGGALRGAEVRSTVGEVIRQPSPAFSTIFYTTSPFESFRRSEVESQGTIDCSPSFNGLTDFSPRSLFDSYAQLSVKENFISEAGISVEELPVPPVVDILDHLMGRYRLRSGVPKLRPIQRPPQEEAQRWRLSHLDKLLPLQSRRLLQLAGESIWLTFDQIPAAKVRTLIKELEDALDLPSTEIQSSIPRRSFRPGTQANLVTVVDRFVDRVAPEARHWMSLLKALMTASVPMRSGPVSVAILESRIGQLVRDNAAVAEHLTFAGILSWRFQNLSSGQVSYLSLFCKVAAALVTARSQEDFLPRSASDRQIVLCIDEGEMFMHPQWQRQFVERLVGFISAMFPNEAPKTHLFVSTHSPIVAADTPAGRLFDLERGDVKNAFGFTPRQTLEAVFKVEDFAGTFSQSRLEEISDALKSVHPTPQELDDALRSVELLADEKLRDYLATQVETRRAGLVQSERGL